MTVTHVVDENTTRTARTDYDFADRPCQTVLHESVNGEQPTSLYKTLLNYDKLNNLTQFAEDIQTEIHTTGYTYDRDNRVTEIAYDGSTHKVKYTYDALGRVATRVAECGATSGKLTSTYGYVAGGYGTNSTTPLVASITQEGVALSYAYDNRGNITSETRNGLTTTYVYDALGQLVRVNDPHEDATWVFNYDRGGNINSKVRYAYTTGTLGTVQETIPYAYNDSNWKDKLTAYNDRTFTYDAIGNPTSDGIWSYEWEVGRRLKSMSAEGTALTFKYDHNGLRTQKVVTKNGVTVTTNYVLHGKLIIHMTVGPDKLHFFYDAENQPMYVNYNGTLYTYIHSLQRDIVGLLDSTGELAVEYKYDAWGCLLSTTGRLAETLGKQNPFRWRCNLYDDESELYYLRERYYSAALSRFINRDDAELDVSTGLLSSNPYTYCKNNPVKFLDTNGEFINMLAGAIAGGIVGAINAALSGDDILAGAAMGAATGAIAGAAVDLAVATSGIGGIAIATVGGSIANTTNYIATEKINGRNIDGGVLAIEAATGALSNVFTFGLAGGTMKKAVGSVWNNMKTTWQKTIYARTTRKVAGRVVRKTSRAVAKRCVLNITSEVGISTVVATGALMHSKFYQRVMLAK